MESSNRNSRDSFNSNQKESQQLHPREIHLQQTLQQLATANKSLAIALEKALVIAEQNQQDYDELESISLDIMRILNTQDEDWTTKQKNLYLRLQQAIKTYK